jgi:hypothetical protein
LFWEYKDFQDRTVLLWEWLAEVPLPFLTLVDYTADALL